MGIRPNSLGPETNVAVNGSSFRDGVPFIMNVQTATGTTTYSWKNDKGRSLAVVWLTGYMTGAGGGGDTVVVNRVRGATTAAITDTIDVSGKADKAGFECGSIDDATNTIADGDTLQVVTASNALCRLWIDCVWLGDI